MTKKKATPKPKVDDRIVTLEKQIADLKSLGNKLVDLSVEVSALQERVQALEEGGVFTIRAVENT